MTPFRSVLWIRWLARLWAGVSAFGIALLFGAEIGAEGLSGLLDLGAAEALMMAAFVVLMLGLALGWHHELLGGWMVVGGLTTIYLVNLAATGHVPAGPWFPLLAAPGFLYLYCARAERAEAPA